MRAPVIMAIDMQRHFAAGPQTHQPAAAPNSADLAHDLLRVRHGPELGGGSHLAVEVVSRTSTRGDEPHRFISFEAGGMGDPGRFWKRTHLALQLGRVEL